jgi:hypothetical protein
MVMFPFVMLLYTIGVRSRANTLHGKTPSTPKWAAINLQNRRY